MKARAFIVILLTLIFVACAVGVIADDFDWPRWRGHNGDGISMETDWNPEALTGGPKILWKVDVGIGHSNVAIKDNRLYTMGRKGIENIIICLNADTGEEIWRYLFKEGQDPQATPTLDGKYVYTLSKVGKLTCLKEKNGKVRWERNLIDEFNTEEIVHGYAGSPVVESDRIILNINTSGIALNKKTGDMIWASAVHTMSKPNYYATPVLYNHEGKRCALLFSWKGLFSVDVETGKQQWFHEWYLYASPNCADPLFFDDKVFISIHGALANCALLDITGNEPQVLWQNRNMRNEFSTCVYVDGYMYGSDGSHGGSIPFRCIDVKNGEVLWEKKLKMVSLIAANNKLILLEEDGTLRIAEATPSLYQEISSCDVLEGEQTLRLFWTPPVLCNEKIYCRNYAGDLVCIDVSK